MARDLLPSICESWWLEAPVVGIVLDYDLLPTGVLTASIALSYETIRLPSCLQAEPLALAGNVKPVLTPRNPHVVLQRSPFVESVWRLVEEHDGGRLDLCSGFVPCSGPLPPPVVLLAVVDEHERRRQTQLRAVLRGFMSTIN